MEQAHFDFLKSVLRHVETFNVDWNGVMQDNGFTRKDNTMTKFKNTMKKYGVEFSNNKFVVAYPSSSTDQIVNSNNSTPKTPRKRGLDTNSESSVANKPSSTPQKKRKTIKDNETSIKKEQVAKVKKESVEDEESDVDTSSSTTS